jgi:aconitate hydratase
MVFDLELIKGLYSIYANRVADARKLKGSPLSLSEKILYAHLSSPAKKAFDPGKDYVNFNPDRVAMQDATAQMALLQFIQANQQRVVIPTTVHCDHLILAKSGATKDLIVARDTNKEVYNFLSSVSNKYGIGFWKP